MDLEPEARPQLRARHRVGRGVAELEQRSRPAHPGGGVKASGLGRGGALPFGRFLHHGPVDPDHAQRGALASLRRDRQVVTHRCKKAARATPWRKLNEEDKQSAAASGSPRRPRSLRITRSGGKSPAPDILRCAYMELIVTDLAASRVLRRRARPLRDHRRRRGDLPPLDRGVHSHHNLVLRKGPGRRGRRVLVPRAHPKISTWRSRSTKSSATRCVATRTAS